jgi:hypothetical protein
VSSWIYIHLDEPASSDVVIAPLLGVVISAGLLLLVVRSTRRRHGLAPAGP